MELKEEALELSREIVAWRRELHTKPEVGLHLPQTAEFILKKLREWGIEYRTFSGHSGIVAVIGTGGGKTVALRADMDGLDIREENNCSFRSQNSCMHACGHDAHTACLLGAAKLLKTREARLKGTVKLIFQPDEEYLTGGPRMVAEGVLQNPAVDAFFTMHVGGIANSVAARTGDVILCRKAVFAASGNFEAVICGKGGHASTPHLSKDPTLAAARFIEGVQAIRSREIDPWEAAALNIAYISAGTRGSAVGIIPESVVIGGGFRSINDETHEMFCRRIGEILKGVCESMGMTYELHIDKGCVSTVNDPAVTAAFLKTAEKVVGAERVICADRGGLGGEDAGAYMKEVPGCYFMLYNLCPSDDGVVYPHHNPRFSIDDSTLHTGTALLAQAAADYLAEN